MIPELSYLVYSVVLVIAYLAVQVLESLVRNGPVVALTYKTDQEKPLSVAMQRFNASFANFLVCYPVFIALALMLATTGLNTAFTALGAAIWFWARVAHIGAHMSGLPVIRTLVWLTSVAGLVMMLMPLG